MATDSPRRRPAGSERQRWPQPLLRRRIASRRAAMDQPNVTGDGDVPLTVRFWVVLVATGVGAGLFGALLMALLNLVSELAFGPGAAEDFQAAVERASPVGRLTPLLVGGVVAGVGWFLLRRYVRGSTDVDDSIWTGDGKLSFGRSAGTSVLSEIVVGLGASLGREAAPKLMGGVCGSLLATWSGLSVPQRRLVVACGAGAGLACVYNVPLAGALFTAEVLVGALRLPVVLPALACSATATLVAWVYLPSGPTYADLPAHTLTLDTVVWAVLAGPVIGVVAVGFVRAIGWVSAHQPSRWWWQITAPILAFGLLGVTGLALPQLLGNGKDMAEQAFVAGTSGVALFAALSLLKPLMTVLCLGSGASGGLFTPTLSSGAALGAALGAVWSLLWPGTPVGTYALIGAAALIGSAMQAPLAGLAMVLELTHSGFALMVPSVAATFLATAVARWIDGYSIYSARLAARPVLERDT
ncbi:chloride channel protein [Pseudonocardia endophytica]|uniref:H+/Cl-antiporter ClcA n=1 Tax=Pseudonocardia endophytica TaxID=401976 RepID=A0A4R1HQK1_PSEEN|nr:chloride channel protein [Pseudonocardia endophytica]TCK23005.1 H+/Cl- antiporter ClcA [Pseudonocardia endophytica]